MSRRRITFVILYGCPMTILGKAFISKYYAEHPEVEMVEAEEMNIDFSRPHAGTKLFTESHWTVPIKTYHNEVVDTQAELIEFLDGLDEEQEVHLQFLLQPAYRTEKTSEGLFDNFIARGNMMKRLKRIMSCTCLPSKGNRRGTFHDWASRFWPSDETRKKRNH